jgi:hypothetical protein
MTAFNVVRFRVKPGREEEFLNAHRNIQADWPGLSLVNGRISRPRLLDLIAQVQAKQVTVIKAGPLGQATTVGLCIACQSIDTDTPPAPSPSHPAAVQAPASSSRKAGWPSMATSPGWAAAPTMLCPT